MDKGCGLHVQRTVTPSSWSLYTQYARNCGLTSPALLSIKSGFSLSRKDVKLAQPTTMLFSSGTISSHLSVLCAVASAGLLLAQSTSTGITPLSSVKQQVFTSIDGDGWLSALPAANMIPVNELVESGLPADCQAVVNFETDPSATSQAVFTTFKMQFDDCQTKEIVVCMAPE